MNLDEYVKLMTLERGDGHIRLRAPAKINLFLEPLHKRTDGFHEILSVMHAIDFCDVISIALCQSGIEVECPHPDVPSGRENLVWRAAEAFASACGIEPGVRITIAKQIPLGGGLGGGSSDAASVLTGMNELYGRRLDRARLAQVAATLGSDVSFFLWGGTALCRGRGERVEPLRPAPQFWVVLVVPPIHVSTKKVYETLRISLTTQHSPSMVLQSINRDDLFLLFQSLHNGLEKTVLSTVPSLCRVWEEVVAEGLPHPQLAGSGSTLYGVCRTEAGAADVSGRLQRRLPRDVRVVVASSRLTGAEEECHGNHRSTDQPEGGRQ